MNQDNGNVASFANHPKTIAEHRAERSGDFDAKDFTPREVLISMLRDLDEGRVNPNALVVAWQNTAENIGGYICSSPNLVVTMGTLQLAMMQTHAEAFGYSQD